MRTLNTRQKEIIMDYVRRVRITPDVKDVILEKLEKINDYETLWSDMERFLNDYIFSLDGGRYILNWRDWR